MKEKINIAKIKEREVKKEEIEKNENDSKRKTFLLYGTYTVQRHCFGRKNRDGLISGGRSVPDKRNDYYRSVSQKFLTPFHQNPVFVHNIKSL